MTKWWLIGAGVVLGALLVGSVVLALLSEETEFAPGTPERAVQDLLRAVENEDVEAVHAMLSEDLLEKCELNEFANTHSYRSDRRDIRAMLRDTKVVDDITFVNVRVTRFRGSGPFDSGESSYDRRFALQKQGGEWKFTEYPWPYDYCPETE